MKTLIFNDTNISTYMFEDGDAVTVSATNTTTPNQIIGDMKSDNATLYENVTPPADWVGGRYTFDGTTWTEVVGWTKPIDPSEAAEVRTKRNILLAETDWWALSDHTMTQAEIDYRQALRDVTAQEGFPTEITWPTKPQ